MRRAMLPQNQNTFSEDDFLEILNEEMNIGVVPHVLSFHEDYYLRTISVPFIIGVTNYDIPHRAMGNKLREVRLKDANGNLFELTRISVEDQPYFQYNNFGIGSNTLRTFSIQGSTIVFNSPPTDTSGIGGFLDIVFYDRPNSLVAESRTARVSAFDRTLNTITLDNFPAVFANQTIFDVTSITNPHKLIIIEGVSSTVPTTSSLVLTFDSLPSSLQIGDVVALPEETIIPQVPQEVVGMLAQRAAMKCLEAMGDTQGLQNALQRLEEMKVNTGSILDSRVEGAPLKINNIHSPLRNSRKFVR